MCSVFGFVSMQGRKANPRTLERIVRANIKRGPHAFGFAWVNPDGRLRQYKQAGALDAYMHMLALTKDAIAMIGHMRWFTHGHPTQIVNNHPHPCDGGWMVHNGRVDKYLALAEEFDVMPTSNCDSEILALVAESIPGRSYIDRCATAVERSRGKCVTLSLWSRPRASLVAVKRGNPLAFIEATEGTYLATQFPASDDALRIEDNQAIQFTFDKDRKDADLTTRALIVPEPEPIPVVPARALKRSSNVSSHPIRETLFDPSEKVGSTGRGSGYRGG